MSIYLLAFLIGVATGLRTLTTPAALSWAVRLGWLHIESTVPFLGYTAITYLFSALAVIELINDKMPKTPSRKAPPSFAMRIIIGTLCGAAFGVPTQSTVVCAITGLAGALVGTLGGYEAPVRLV